MSAILMHRIIILLQIQKINGYEQKDIHRSYNKTEVG